MSNSSGACADNTAKSISVSDRYIPKEKICTNPDCFGRFHKKGINSNYCDACGKELEDRVADMYVELVYSRVTSQFEEENKKKKNKKKNQKNVRYVSV